MDLTIGVLIVIGILLCFPKLYDDYNDLIDGDDKEKEEGSE